MDSHQEDEKRLLAEQQHQRQLDRQTDDALLEHEAVIEQHVDEHWCNIDKFHDFIFKEVNGFVFVPPRITAYLEESEAEDRLHTNDEFTPRTFSWMLLEFDDLRQMWANYLRRDFHVDR